MKSHFDMKHTTYVQELNYCKNTTLLFSYFFPKNKYNILYVNSVSVSPHTIRAWAQISRLAIDSVSI